MAKLLAAFANLAGMEDAVHRAHRAMIAALIQQGGVDFGRRLVTEAPRIQDLKDPLMFGRRQGAGRARSKGAGGAVGLIGRRWRYSEARGTLSARQAAAAPEKPADLTAATDNLARLLGKKKRSFNKPWYDGLES